MNITSYNITDVTYHYIGLRALGCASAYSDRSQQTDAISRNVLKFVNDKALRLMLPEPRSSFGTVGERVCQELVHLRFACSNSKGYELTDSGEKALRLLTYRQYAELRRLMISMHLRTYDNLRAIIQKHLEVGAVWRPIVTAGLVGSVDYLSGLLKPTFGNDADEAASAFSNGHKVLSPKKTEDWLHGKVIARLMPNEKIAVSIFRSICSRLASLRLLNVRRAKTGKSSELEFAKSYSPCVQGSPVRPWHAPMDVALANGENYQIHLSEPNLKDASQRTVLLEALEGAFSEMSPVGGYYDIPDLRDSVCERLMLPEPAFDEGLNILLDLRPSVLSAGLRYEGISSQRKPLVRNRGDVQIYNLIRRT